jgi:hypothetical protein
VVSAQDTPLLLLLLLLLLPHSCRALSLLLLLLLLVLAVFSCVWQGRWSPATAAAAAAP